MIEIGSEYMYLGNFVKVLAINCDEVTFETRFGDVSTCLVDELTPKPTRRIDTGRDS